MSDANQTVKLAKGSAALPTMATVATLARYAEWSDSTVYGDANDAVSTYAMLARMERTVVCSSLDLGLEL